MAAVVSVESAAGSEDYEIEESDLDEAVKAEVPGEAEPIGPKAREELAEEK